MTQTAVREWTDEKTGRTVRQLTDEPEGARAGYFRVPRRLPDGRVLAWPRRHPAHPLAIDPESGGVEKLPPLTGHPLRLRESDGRLWSFLPQTRKLYATQMPHGEPVEIGQLPNQLPGHPADITCDGATVILIENTQDRESYPLPNVKDSGLFWRYFARPRRGTMWSYELASGRLTKLVQEDGVVLDHVDTSPTDPHLVRFCHDSFVGQRIWTVRTDGTELRKVRPQEPYEIVVHEFWWPGGQLIAYKYQDRRGDPTVHELPWCEYSPGATHFGLASLDGVERYFSEPLNHYHSHIFVSPDATLLCGEGTEISSHVCAARFSQGSRKVEFIRMATIHTKYIPFGGQGVDSGFSADGRWLLYNDTVEGKHQVCAVKVDL